TTTAGTRATDPTRNPEAVPSSAPPSMARVLPRAARARAPGSTTTRSGRSFWMQCATALRSTASPSAATSRQRSPPLRSSEIRKPRTATTSLALRSWTKPASSLQVAAMVATAQLARCVQPLPLSRSRSCTTSRVPMTSIASSTIRARTNSSRPVDRSAMAWEM
ncbi:rsmA, partial [Symbiodinium sp. CCMP2456]